MGSILGSERNRTPNFCLPRVPARSPNMVPPLSFVIVAKWGYEISAKNGKRDQKKMKKRKNWRSRKVKKIEGVWGSRRL